MDYNLLRFLNALKNALEKKVSFFFAAIYIKQPGVSEKCIIVIKKIIQEVIKIDFKTYILIFRSIVIIIKLISKVFTILRLYMKY